jgi:oligoendopeptidase F
MKGEKAHLRTRIGKNGMDYKGYNIAIHELGHNVEQTLTLYDVDNWFMKGVPNTAFTEAWAFCFQNKDLDLLGIKNNNQIQNQAELEILDKFWACYEIMGVSLVDQRVWKWMYENSNCNAEELKNAVIKIANDVWNAYYSPIFGMKDCPILAIYSHMIEIPLYLSAYPIGHLIEFQINEYIKDKNLGNEMLRMCIQGRLIPDIWMKNAVGSEVSSKPLLEAAKQACSVFKEKE